MDNLSLKLLQIPSWSGEQKISPISRDNDMVCGGHCGCNILDFLVKQKSHLSICYGKTSNITVMPPVKWTVCLHDKYSEKNILGKGEYGSVFGISDTECVKTFESQNAFYHEMIVCDLIDIARLRSQCPEKSMSLMFLNSVCIPCKKLFFPRYRGNLETFPHWTSENIPRIVKGFEGLLDAVVFLNEDCGLFHSDISLCNILVGITQNETHLGKLVLTDMGLATLHTGNPQTELALKALNGKPLYDMFVNRNPFLVCKDAYKPACILFRCFILATGDDDMEDSVSPACADMAKVIDISCLAYCLLNVIEKLMDVSKSSPTDRFYLNCTLAENNPIYYVKCLVHKVILLEFLSGLWNTHLSIGANSQGEFDSVILSPTLKKEFISWCENIKALYTTDLFSNSNILLSNIHLRDCLSNLLSLDSFSACGRGD
ncbi:tegument serine/threonine protein kinase [Vespertilionid gammaherpesvirus 1]|uniref:Tegument serine/threonine protein kinase n=1 Tax=Vespertilionid gammaherpesvirus 1 TaxID=2560830 RepID=A0A109QFP5_9GAMA|nr:tegument serine/threonine protein kinase [Myotis gammaherpesvirus 8]AMA67392.1 tegument serine/threonine protein kinase [Vespertilionid gammaherpesvirus 1]